ncbi:Phospholipase D delta [Bienertia sinuspersici]
MEASGNNRKIKTFLGGLDLCDGHYDTLRQHLFRDLDTVFQHDYHNPTLDMSFYQTYCLFFFGIGPRQPWHDHHCKIEGLAAYDVLTTFEQCWRKATRSSLRCKIKSASQWHDDPFVKVDRFFQSIDSGSVEGLPKDVLIAESQVCPQDIFTQ